MKKSIFAIITIATIGFLASNQGCETGTDGIATFDEVMCGHSSYTEFEENNPNYSPISDEEVWISETADKKSKVKRKYTVGTSQEAQYMQYPLATVSMAQVENEYFYFFTYKPESSVYVYDNLEEMVVVVYNCMGRKVKNINYGESSAGDYHDVVEEIYDQLDSYYFYSGYYIIDQWRVS